MPYQNKEVEAAYQRQRLIKEHIRHGGTPLAKDKIRDLLPEELAAKSADNRPLTDYEVSKKKLLVSGVFTSSQLADKQIELREAQVEYETLKKKHEPETNPTKKRKRKHTPVEAEETRNASSVSVGSAVEAMKTENASSVSAGSAVQAEQTKNASSGSAGSAVEAEKTENASSVSAGFALEAIKTENASSVSAYSPSILSQALATLIASKEELDTKQCDLEDKRITLAKNKKEQEREIQSLKTNIAKLEPSAKKVPALQRQLNDLKVKLRDAEKSLAIIEVKIKKNAHDFKDAASQLKELVKQEAVIQKQVDLENAEAEVTGDVLETQPCASDVPVSTDLVKYTSGSPLLAEIFGKIESEQQGVVTKASFIKGLADPQVADFFKLSTSIKPEDGTRTAMEAKFQSMSGTAKTFSKQQFLDTYDV